MTEQQLPISIPQMHTASKAIPEPSAVFALILPHPGTVSVRLVSVLPHVSKFLPIDISLGIIAPYAGTGRN